MLIATLVLPIKVEFIKIKKRLGLKVNKEGDIFADLQRCFFQVSKIVDDIYEQLSWNSSHTMKNVLLRVISLLIRASPKKVIFQLMEFPVPADE